MTPFSRSLLTGLLLAMAGAPAPVWSDGKGYVEFDTPELKKGRTIWMDSCENCHGYGTAGAPIPMNPDEWDFRIKKGKPVLYDHAINGFFGPDDTMMPERGGNPELTDDEVKAAVDYMTSLAKHYIDKK